MGLQIFKGKEKTPEVAKREEDLLTRVASTDVWKLNPEATAKFVNDLISLLQSIPFSRDLHLKAPSQLPDRVKQILETAELKTTELEVKFNALIPAQELYYHLGCANFNLAKYKEAENYFEKAAGVSPKHFKSLLALGLARMELDKDVEALETMKKLIEIEPNNETGWYTLGLILYKLKKHEDEIECYERAIAINRKYEPAWNNRGLTLYELGRYGEAAENFAEALKVNPKNEKFWHGMGLVHMKLNNLDTALKDFETAIQINPNYAEAWHNKAMVLFHLNKYHEALQAVEQAISLRTGFRDALLLKGKILEKTGNVADALAIFEAIISSNPEIVEPYLAKAELMDRMNNTKEALAALDTAINLSQSPEAYLLKARILRTQGSTEDALRVYLQILEKDKANYTVMRLAGECLYELGRYEEASQMFKKVLSVQVNAHDAWFWKGRCDIKRNAIKDGLHAMEMAISLSPKNVKYIREIIKVAKEIGQNELLQRYMEALSSIEQDNPEVWYEKAKTYFEMGKVEEAEKAAEKAIALKKDYNDALFLLARIKHIHGKIPEAIEILENVIENDNKNYAAWLFLASLKNQIAQPEDALICAERAIELKESAEAHYQRGLALKSLGKLSEAGNAFSRALELDNNFVNALIARGDVLDALKSHESAFESYALAYEKTKGYAVLQKLIALAEKAGKIEKTLQFIEESLAKDEKNPVLWLSYGRLLFRKGEKEKALRAFEKGLAYEAENLALLKSVFECYKDLGRYEEAVKTGLKIVEAEESAEMWYEIGNLLHKLGKEERALECYQQSLELKPDMVEALIARGKIFEAKGATGDAEKEYRKALEIEPESYGPRFALALLLKSEKKYDEALEHIEKALSIDKNAQAMIEKARILAAIGKLEESIKAYEEAYQISQQIPEILYEKAVQLEKLGLPGPAIEALEKNLRLHKHYPTALLLMQILESTGNLEQALEVCKTAIEDYSEKDIFLLAEERLLQKLGRAEELLAHYDRMLEKSKTADLLYKKAELLWKLARYSEARESIEEALSFEKKPEYFILYARITADAGSIEGALSILTKGLRAFKAHTELIAEKARLLCKAGRWEEAEEIAQELIERAPEKTEFLELVARVKMEKRDYSGAIELIKKILQISPENGSAMEMLGDAFFQTSRFEEAMKWYEKGLEQSRTPQLEEKAARTALALKNYEMALKHTDALLKSNPDNVEWLVMKGEALAGLNRFIYALETYNRALRISPENGKALYGRALALARIGDVSEALNTVEKALAYGKTPEVMKLRAKVLAKLGRFEEVIKACDEILSSLPDEPEILLEKGTALESLGRSQEAENLFLHLLEVEPDNSKAHYYLGKIYAEIAEEKAISHLEKAVALEPNNVEARMLLAEIYRKHGQEGMLKAGEQYEAVLIYEPKNRAILYKLAELYLANGNLEKALDYINAYLAEEPNASDALFLRGKILMKQEKWREACRTFDKLLKNSDIAEARLVYASALIKLNRFADARAEIEKYIQSKGQDLGSALALANCAEMEGNYDEALALYDKALSIEFNAQAVEGKIRVLRRTNNYPGLFEFYRKMLAKEEKEETYIEALNALANFGTKEEIEEFIHQAISRFPNSFLLAVRKAEQEEKWGEREKAVLSYRRALELNLTDADIWYRCARLYRELGNLGSATECLDKAIELRPDNPVYLEEKGKLAYAMLELDLAIRNFDAAIEIEDRAEAWFSLGKIMHDIGRYAEALRCFEKAGEKLENAEVWAYRGRTLLRMGNTEESLRCFQKAISIDKGNEMAKYFIGSILAKNGKEAEKILGEISGQMEADAQVQIGNIYFRNKKFEEALRKYERAKEIERTKIEAWNNLGVALAKCGLFDEAIDAFDEAIEIEKEYSKAWYNRGVVLLRVEAVMDALDALSLSGRYEGSKPEIQTAIGTALLLLERYENAIKMLEEVVAKGEYKEALYNLAIAYLQIGMPDKALGFAKRVYEIEKSDEAKYLLAYGLWLSDEKECLEFFKNCEPASFSFAPFYLLKGFLEIKHGEFEQGIRSLDKAISVSPEVWLLRAYAYIAEKKYGDASRSVDAALAKGEKSALAFMLKGVADFYAGNYKRAEKLLERAVAIERNAVTCYNLASLYFKTGKHEEAVKMLSNALKFEPKNEKFRFYKMLILGEMERKSSERVEELGEEIIESKGTILDAHDITITLSVEQSKGVELVVKNEMFKPLEPFKLALAGMITSGEIEVPALSSKEEKAFSLTYSFNMEEETNLVPGIDLAITSKLYSRGGRVYSEVELVNLKAFALKNVHVRALEGLGYTSFVEEKVVDLLEPMEKKKLGFTMVPSAFKKDFEEMKGKYGREMEALAVLPQISLPEPEVIIPDFKIEDEFEYTKYSELRLQRILRSMEIRSKAIEELLKMPVFQEVSTHGALLVDDLELSVVKRK